MTFNDIDVDNHSDGYTDAELIEWAEEYAEYYPAGFTTAVIKRWVRAERKLAAWSRAAEHTARRVDNTTEEELNRRLHMLERQNELFARLIGEIERSGDCDKTARQQIEAISSVVERLRDEVRKLPRNGSYALADIVERLLDRVANLETAVAAVQSPQFVQGVVSTTTTVHPYNVEAGGMIDVTPRCGDAVTVATTHPFNGRINVPTTPIETYQWEQVNIGDNDADG